MKSALPWIGLPAAGAAWAIWHLRKMYFFYDEWSMIERVLHVGGADGMTASYNGHLFMLQYWMYRVQVSFFGVDSHFFIAACFVVALIALHFSIAAVLRASGLPRQFSLLLGGLLTYLGAASQNFIFTFQVSLVLSIAFGLFAAAIVLQYEPSARVVAAVAVCLLASALVATAVATGAVVLVGIIAVVRWKLWAAVAAVSPAALVLIWWFTTADLGPKFPATREARVLFAIRLTRQSIGAVVGHGQWAGLLLGVVVTALIVFALVRKWLSRDAILMLVAGVASAGFTVAAISQSRAGLPGFNFVDFNRYLSYVAIPLTLAATPALAAIARVAATSQIMSRDRVAKSARALPIAAVVIAFLCGLAPLESYEKTFTYWNVQTRHDVRAATIVIDEGCPSGVPPDALSVPSFYPQITTQLLRELMDKGALSVAPADAADPAVTARMCPQG